MDSTLSVPLQLDYSSKIKHAVIFILCNFQFTVLNMMSILHLNMVFASSNGDLIIYYLSYMTG